MVGVLPARIFTDNRHDNMTSPRESGKNEGVVRVGSRIKCENSFGTVKYVGEVSGYNGLWYGVDWDDAGRGKHDGSVSGVRYFEANQKTSGSFVRHNKIASSISCADAIKTYYGEKEDENTEALYKAVIDDWRREIKVPFIEMVGFDTLQMKQSNLSRLTEASVSDMNVDRAGELSALCPSLRFLDLSKNLLPDWGTVADIAGQLPNLERLDISKNYLQQLLPDDALSLSRCFPNLTKIIMTHCGLDWQSVKHISLMLPKLEVLVLVFNRISQIGDQDQQEKGGNPSQLSADENIQPCEMCSCKTGVESMDVCNDDVANTFELNSKGHCCYRDVVGMSQNDGMVSLLGLTHIILDGNPLDDWVQIMNLSRLPQLRVLCLNECALKEIRFDDRFEGEKTECFKSLEVLHLKQNRIGDWRSVSELDKLKCLQKLYFLKNPITECEDYDTSTQLVIARIQNLKEFNGSEVSKEARRGAEYDYLKRHGKEWKRLHEGNGDIREFCLEHSRFKQLIKKHGIPDDSLLEKKEHVGGVINTKLIQLVLKDAVSGVSISKKLPSTMSVQKLSSLARRLFSAKLGGAGHMSGGEPSLYCVYTSKSDARKEMTVRLDNQLKELDYFSVADGDTVLIKW